MKANLTNIASSRPLGVAKSLGAPVLDEATIFARDVILTGEQAVLETNNGRWCLLNSLRLLCRVVGPLTVVLPQGMDELQKEVRQLAVKVWSWGTVTVVNEVPPAAMRNATAILSIGSAVHPHLPWTTINANGWVARVSSGTGVLPTDTGQSNPLAAMMAASLGVTEVFKRVYGIPRENSPLLEATQFSLFELSTSPSSIGPPLPTRLSLPDTLVVGAGAIGNGIALLLSREESCEPTLFASFAQSHRLTRTEEQVLQLLCRCLRTPEIALQMKVAVSTIRSHVRSLCVKTSSHGVRQLINLVSALPQIAPTMAACARRIH